jgi:hypothetical protein
MQGNEIEKGFVIYNQNANGKLILVIKTHKIEQNAEFTVDFITAGERMDGGISDTGHHGNKRNQIGTLETNTVGNGNSHFHLDVEDLLGINPDIDVNYGHIDLEDYSFSLGLPLNYYGATPISWLT